MRSLSRPSPATLAICLVAMAAASCQPSDRRQADGANTAQGQMIAPVSRVPQQRTVTLVMPLEDARDRGREVLDELGFGVRLTDSSALRLEGRTRETVPPAWIACRPITLRDPFSSALRSRRVEANSSEMLASLAFDPQDGATRVTISTQPIGIYVNPFTNTPEERGCGSTGAAEALIDERLRRER